MDTLAREKPASLDAETRVAIDDYLKEKVRYWSAFLGIANVAVLLGSLTYIFFILPNKMASEAQQASARSLDQLVGDLKTRAADFQKELTTQSELFHDERGRREESMRWMQREFTNATARFDNVRQALSSLERSVQGTSTNSPALLQLVTTLQSATNIQDMIRDQVNLRLTLDAIAGDVARLKTLNDDLAVVRDGLARLATNVVLRDTAYLLVTRAGDRALDVGDSGRGKDVQVYTPHGRNNQQWLIRVPTP